MLFPFNFISHKAFSTFHLIQVYSLHPVLQIYYFRFTCSAGDSGKLKAVQRVERVAQEWWEHGSHLLHRRRSPQWIQWNHIALGGRRWDLHHSLDRQQHLWQHQIQYIQWFPSLSYVKNPNICLNELVRQRITFNQTQLQKPSCKSQF